MGHAMIIYTVGNSYGDGLLYAGDVYTDARRAALAAAERRANVRPDAATPHYLIEVWIDGVATCIVHVYAGEPVTSPSIVAALGRSIRDAQTRMDDERETRAQLDGHARDGLGYGR